VAVEEERPQAFGGAVHGGREPRGPRADDHEVVNLEGGRQWTAEALGHLTRLRIRQNAPVLEEERRQRVRADARRLEQSPRLRFTLDVQPAVRNEIAREKVLDLVGPRGPLVPDQAQTGRLRQRLGLPGIELVVDDREEPLLRRVPRLRQVVIEVALR
jgi:hypothetical protein